MSHPPITASKVLPVAIPSEVKMSPAVVRLTRKAPMKIAGVQERELQAELAGNEIDYREKNGRQ